MSTCANMGGIPLRFSGSGRSCCSGTLAGASDKDEVRAGPELRRDRSSLSSSNYKIVSVTRGEAFQRKFLSRWLSHRKISQKTECFLTPNREKSGSCKAD